MKQNQLVLLILENYQRSLPISFLMSLINLLLLLD